MHRTAAHHYRVLNTPTGDFMLAVRGDGTIETGWVSSGLPPRGRRDNALLPDLADRLTRYFEGEEVSFDDVPVPAASEFLRRCWIECRAIPRGETITYTELARRAGSESSAARAAGQAMRRNRQPILTPCHRVIGTGGRLHGFAGSMSSSSQPVAIKRFLLEMESAKPRVVVGLLLQAASI